MVPPKLKLVSNTDGHNGATPDQADETSAEAVELAAALADAQTALPGGFTTLASLDRGEQIRILEAVLFASPEPLDEAMLGSHLPDGEDIAALLSDLQGLYADRGVHLVQVSGKWVFRTAGDLSFVLEKYAHEERRLSKAALETLAIIAYHQPVTRAEIEEVRGVSISSGTLDILMEAGWARPRGRRRAPGKPITYGTTDAFLSHFGLQSVKDLPGLQELKAAGLLDSTLPPGFEVPSPTDVAALMPDELPLDEESDDDSQDELDLLHRDDGESLDEDVLAELSDDTQSDDDDLEVGGTSAISDDEPQH
jgi:segregation and condensation protein B